MSCPIDHTMPELTCGICLDGFKSPVVTPCGHIHCKKCLHNYIRSGTDAIQSTCPTCRAPFHIVTPDLDYIPEKLHPFIMPSVRRIYLHVDSNDNTNTSEFARLKQKICQLQKQNRTLETRVKAQARDNNLLMEKCESYMASSRVNAERERSTRLGHEELHANMEKLTKKYNCVKTKYNRLKASSNVPEPGQSSPTRPIKRKSSELFPDLWTSLEVSNGSFTGEPASSHRSMKRMRLPVFDRSGSQIPPPPVFNKPVHHQTLEDSGTAEESDDLHWVITRSD